MEREIISTEIVISKVLKVSFLSTKTCILISILANSSGNYSTYAFLKAGAFTFMTAIYGKMNACTWAGLKHDSGAIHKDDSY